MIILVFYGSCIVLGSRFNFLTTAILMSTHISMKNKLEYSLVITFISTLYEPRCEKTAFLHM